MLDIGRIAYKISGREAGKIAVIVDKIDDNFVLVDGQVKRKRCNITHLEPTEKLIKIKKNANHDDVVSELKKLNIETKVSKPRKKKAGKEEIKTETKRETKEEKKEVKKEEKKEPEKKEIKKKEKKKEAIKIKDRKK